jgi:hypothetical protein
MMICFVGRFVRCARLNNSAQPPLLQLLLLLFVGAAAALPRDERIRTARTTRTHARTHARLLRLLLRLLLLLAVINNWRLLSFVVAVCSARFQMFVFFFFFFSA